MGMEEEEEAEAEVMWTGVCLLAHAKEPFASRLARTKSGRLRVFNRTEPIKKQSLYTRCFKK
jgi:hypothetical protein